METTQILTLLAVVVVGYFVLKFLWNATKGILKLVLTVIIIAVGVYLVKPELLYNVFGKENVEQVADKTKEVAKEGAEKVEKLTKDSLENVTNQ
jgi:hypothetical protein